MEGSRTRTILGIGLVLVGSLLLLRALVAPFGPPIEQVARVDQQRALAEMRRAELEAQRQIQQAEREAQRARLEAQRALQEQAHSDADAQLSPPPLPAMPPLPPAPPFFHLGPRLNLTLVLLGLLILMLWRRSQGTPRQA
jgi:hypothetical protein